MSAGLSYTLSVGAKSLLWSVLFISSVCRAEILPGGLSSGDIANMTRFIAMGGAVRTLRSAESYPTWPGVKAGAEITLFPGGAISSLGDQTGSVGGFIPMPRVYLCKGFYEKAELILSFFPFGLNSIQGGGAIVKWTFFNEKEKWMSLAGIIGLTAISAFQTEFEGTNMEVGVLISKDYVRSKPFVGASLMVARGRVSAAATSGPNESGQLLGTHLYIGAEFELPVNLTAQLDLINTDPVLSLFVGKKF